MALPPPTNPNTRPNDPIQLLDRSAREFLSRRDLDPRRRSTTPAPLSGSNGYYASNGYHSPSPSSTSSAIAAHRAMGNVLPPISSQATDYSARRNDAKEIGRSSTAVPPGGQSIYPGHMLPPSRSNSSYAPYANPDPRSSGGYHHPTPQYPSPGSPPSSPPYSHSRSPLSSGSIASPPPQSPSSSVSSRHSHSNSRGYHPSSPPPLQHPHVSQSSGALTDYASSGRLVPNRHSRRTSHDIRHSPASSTSSHHYSSSTSSSGYPNVGPALANNLPPVLPPPPNTSGSTIPYAPRRSSTLSPGAGATNGRSRRQVSTLRGIDDEDATNAVNTYHRA